ncbi:VOC family protein [Speluncibacter jeojiensis]|uniref:VOC family protein n=1 Tax=Speluncibacter jeojiensis TaxID=2710754 RepID=A0A9X4RC07_9ACTN|nr:VOC family protein [Corynebacteriales bacterium D3-21]
MHLTQIRLIVSDFAGTFEFYRDVIGLVPQNPDPTPPYAAFKPDLGSALCLHERADLARALGGAAEVDGPRGRDAALVVLRVDDLEGYLEAITARGARPLAPPSIRWGTIAGAYLRDPEGNLIEIQQWLATRDGGPVPPAS